MRLVTIGFSHFCEKARWALEYHGVDFEEAPQAPLFHVWAVKRAGGDRATPVLVTDDVVLPASTDILPWLEARAGRPVLYGETSAETNEIEGVAAPFDARLGPATRRMVYHHLLPETELARGIFRSAAPRGQGWLVSASFPAVRAVMRKAMRIDDAGAARSQATIDALLADVEARLADGRRYLCGDRFTAADLTFAALGAPLVRPAGYGWPLPPMEALPLALRAWIEANRERPAGRFITRIYADHRREVLGATHM